MGKITIQNYTCKNPITMIGFEAGICWGADTADEKKNYRRGLDCLESGHGRTFEFPDVYLTLEGYSARVIREWYTHIGGQPTRLQASTRYINYEHGFDYVTPASIAERSAAKAVYDELMAEIQKHLARLDELGVPREEELAGNGGPAARHGDEDRLQAQPAESHGYVAPEDVQPCISRIPRTVQRPLSGAEQLLEGMGLHSQPLLHAEVQSHRFLPGEAFLRQNAAQRIERKYHTGENLIAILSRVVSAAYDSDASAA